MSFNPLIPVISQVGQLIPVGGDPFWDDVRLLMKFDGTHDENITPVDLSGYHPSFNISATAPKYSNVQSMFGTTSGRFINTSSTVIYAAMDGDITGIGTGDYTIEYWAYPLSGEVCFSMGKYIEGDSNHAIISGALNPSGQPNVWRQFTGNFPTTEFAFGTPATSPVYNANNWHHLALARESGTVRAFVDGTQRALSLGSASTSTFPPAGNFYVGSGESNAGVDTPAFFFNGYIQEIRITVGVARYNANFTPTFNWPDF